MKNELRKDIQEYGFLVIVLCLMMIGMLKCTKHVDKYAARYNNNSEPELSQLKKAYMKQRKK